MVDAVWNFIIWIGGVSLLLWRLVKSLPQIPKAFRHFVYYIYLMGIGSLPIVLSTSLFTGMVTAFQAGVQSMGLVPDVYIGMSVAKAMLVELGPILTGLVVAGRVSSSIAAELGTMKVTEQIDALKSLAIDPVRFLVLPRVAAGVVITPILTVFSEIMGMIGGFWVCRVILDITTHIYLRGLQYHFDPAELWGGMTKALVFGFILSFMGCYYGLRTEGGAEGVGISTTKAVVASSVLILISDYLIARLVFG